MGDITLTDVQLPHPVQMYVYDPCNLDPLPLRFRNCIISPHVENTQVHTYTHKKGIQVHTYTHKKGIQVHTYTHKKGTHSIYIHPLQHMPSYPR